MLINTLSDLDSFLKKPNSLASATSLRFDRLLMVSPEYFRILYAINPYMQDSQGKLKEVDLLKAKAQWENLKFTFEKLSFPVSVLSAEPELPDMVFAANPIFPFLDFKTGRKKVLLAQMRSPYRQPEVDHFQRWLLKEGFEVAQLQSKTCSFEGNGDALLHPGQGFIWGGYGPRTDKTVYQEIAERFGCPIITLQLKSPDFYHLDTCFSILNHETVAYQKDAFSIEDQKKIERVFKRIISIDHQENLQNFAGNCFSPNGKDVILQKGAKKFTADLERAGFHPIEVDTSEFIKAGGSVFCLKNQLFSLG